MPREGLLSFSSLYSYGLTRCRPTESDFLSTLYVDAVLVLRAGDYELERTWRQDYPKRDAGPEYAADSRNDEGSGHHTRTGASKLWAGTVVVKPDAKTGPHHHGELETVLYVVRGRARMRWGEHLEFSDEAGPGDFIYVPPYVPHQEINASADDVCEAVVVRSGQDPIVVNLEVETPEKASPGSSAAEFHP